MKYIVYCTTNNVNSKVYIGVHGTEDPNKFDKYLGCGVKIGMPSTYMKPETQFQAAVKEFGTSAFSRKTLFIYDDEDSAYKKEAEIVNEDFIKLDTNYNMILGGGKFRPTQPIYQFTVNGKLVKKWKTLAEAQEFFNCTINAFKTALHFREKLFGFFWSRNDSIDISIYSKGDSPKRVYKYTKNGKMVTEFQSMCECSKLEGISTSSLVTAIRGECLVNKQYYYSYSVYETFKPKPRISLKNKKFYLYNLEGMYLQTFETLKDLMTFMGVKSHSSVHDVINRRNGLYKTFQIKTEFSESISPIENKSLSKKVDVYDKTGNLIKTCDSVQKAAKEFNAKVSSINRVLRGLACTTAGYIFKFHKE